MQVIDIRKPNKIVASEIDTAFKKFGFFYLVGHNISENLMQSFYQECIKFFSQTSNEDKMNVAQPETSKGKYTALGFTPVGIETVAQSKGINSAHDILESFCFRKGANEPHHDISKLPEKMVQLAQEYWKQVRLLDIQLMQLCAIALGFDENYFSRYCNYDNAIMKCAYYPAITENKRTNPRYGEHTDYMFLTLLFADPFYDSHIGGLEVWDTINLKWIYCPKVPNSFIVNIGDLLQRLTNDRWIANLHRVAPIKYGESVKERLSIIYFNSPDDDALVETISINGEEIKYAPIKTSDFFQQKLKSGTTK